MMKKPNNLRRLFYTAFLCFALMASCGGGGPEPADVAARAAKIYYDSLLAGGYEQWVDAQYRPDSIPASYRQQLIDNARMYAGGLQSAHKGLAEVHVGSATADVEKHVADVFLLFVYGDSTREQVHVPMVEHKGVWYLR